LVLAFEAKCDELLSNFAFNFDLRHYGVVAALAQAVHRAISAHTAAAASAGAGGDRDGGDDAGGSGRGGGGVGGGRAGDGGEGGGPGGGGDRRGPTRGDDEDDAETARARRNGGPGTNNTGSANGNVAASARGGDANGGGGSGGSGGGIVVLVAGIEDLADLPAPLRQCFTHEIKVSPPGEPERLAILRASLGPGVGGRGLHSSTSQLNLSCSVIRNTSYTPLRHALNNRYPKEMRFPRP
jgi:hypothetical protein